MFVEMPGVDRSDVQLAWNDGVLIISGVKRQQTAGEGAATIPLCRTRLWPFPA